MSRPICFIANYGKTFFFERVARELSAQGRKIYWVTVNKRLKDALEAGWGAESVLYLHKSIPRSEPIDDFRINEVVLSDRVLRAQPKWAGEYLESIQLPIVDFIKQNKIGFFVGEITWGHEILIYRISKKLSSLGCVFLNPHTVRIPKLHFGIFLDEYQTELMQRKSDNKQVPPSLQPEKPDYLHLNDRLLKKHFSFSSRVSRLVRFASGSDYDREDPTVIHGKFKKLVKNLAVEFNKETYRFVSKASADEFSGKKYILYLLHKQPEASIDVLGRYYEDQYLNVVNIWRAAPSDVVILVKEHSNAIGDRGILFYSKLKRLPGVYLLGESVDAYTLIAQASAVVTVSGTAAYEAALMGVDSYTFAPTFFNGLDKCRRVNLDEIQNNETLFASSEGANVSEFSEWLSYRMFRGIISDPVSNPACVSDENIKCVTDAIVEATEVLGMNYGTPR